MNLIECIAEYYWQRQEKGLAAACKWLQDVVDPECHKHIMNCFNADGELITADGDLIDTDLFDGMR